MARSNKIGFKGVRLLGEFGNLNGADIPDPYYLEKYEDGVEKIYDMIKGAVEDLIEKLSKNLHN